MITFENLGNLGRLGNQLFQYAALLGLAKKNGYEIKIPNPDNKNWHGQTSQLNEFNIEAKFLTPDDRLNLKYSYNEPRWDKVDYNFLNLPDNININGFFQSTAYFEHCFDEIKKQLTPKKEHLDKNQAFIDELKNKHPNHEIVSIHLRRGDNTQGMNEGSARIAYTSMFNNGGLYFNYLDKAKKFFGGKKVKYLIFTGGSRGNEDNTNDMDWCKDQFIGNDFIFSDKQKPINDFCRIMLCDHNITCHISSFGYWAAFLNPNPNKIVIAPKYYHPEDQTLIREKFYPYNFKLIE